MMLQFVNDVMGRRARTARTGNFNIAVMCRATVLGYSAVTECVQCVFELPEGVALEIEACGQCVRKSSMKGKGQ
jgi:hypothetical protein